MIPVCNLLVDIGATMGERLVYHSSLGFCFLLAWPIQFLKNTNFFSFERGSIKQFIFPLFIGLLPIYLLLTINRNKDWYNNITLYNADFPKSPNNLVLISNKAKNLLLEAEKCPNKTL
jgi:hypothetical protein